MSQTTDLNYVLDRITIQDLIGKYGLGQDLHQPGDKDQNVLEQWSHVFASDAVIDAPFARCLREFCVTRLCFVVLSRALGSICNGHPASEVVKNQYVTIAKTSISTDRRASNQEVGLFVPNAIEAVRH